MKIVERVMALKTKAEARLAAFEHNAWVRAGTPGDRYWFRLIRIAPSTLRSVMDNDQFQRARSLTYTTILSVIPVGLISLMVLEFMGVWDQVQQKWLPMYLSEYPDLYKIFDTVLQKIQEANVKAVGYAGILFLLTTLYGMYGEVETALNAVWRTPRGSNFFTRVGKIMLSMLIVPALIVLSTIMELLNKQGLDPLLKLIRIDSMPMVNFQHLPGWTTLASILLVGLAMSWLFKVMPSRQIPPWSALAGGMAGGTLFILTTKGYFALQVGVANLSAFYSSLAALPITLIWIYWSWMMLLFGAEICFSHYRSGKAEGLFYSFGGPLAEDRLTLSVLAYLRRCGGKGSDALRIASAVDAKEGRLATVMDHLKETGLIKMEGDGFFYNAEAAEAMSLDRALDPSRRREVKITSGARPVGGNE